MPPSDPGTGASTAERPLTASDFPRATQASRDSLRATVVRSQLRRNHLRRSCLSPSDPRPRDGATRGQSPQHPCPRVAPTAARQARISPGRAQTCLPLCPHCRRAELLERPPALPGSCGVPPPPCFKGRCLVEFRKACWSLPSVRIYSPVVCELISKNLRLVGFECRCLVT